jgi:hypothetical protein
MLRDSLATAGLASVVAASFDPPAAEALNHAGLALGFAALYVEALRIGGADAPRTRFAPEPGQIVYRRWNADGSYDTIIWPYGSSVVEDQFAPYGNRIPPNARS